MIRNLFAEFRRNDPTAVTDPNAMRRHIEKEIARVDRNDCAFFAILTFRFKHRRLSNIDSRTVFQCFSDRLRINDEFGWVTKCQIAVLLRETDREVAAHVAQQMTEILNAHNLSSSYELTMYPDDDSQSTSDDQANQTLQFATGEESVPVIRNSVINDLLPSRFNAFAKRSLDILGAVSGLVLFSPVILVAGVLVKSTSHGSIFFSQQREGKDGRQFKMYKLRTMYADADQIQHHYKHLNEQDGPAFKIQNDPRITPVGKFLRDKCFDELPQLWNVLRGEMSLVGPRPLPIHESKQCLPWQRNRLRVKPGLTCFWQMNGGTKVSFNQWMRMDLQYVKRQSVLTDLKLIFQTILTVLHLRPAKDA